MSDQNILCLKMWFTPKRVSISYVEVGNPIYLVNYVLNPQNPYLLVCDYLMHTTFKDIIKWI